MKNTFHDKRGRFTSYDKANVVNQGGERFKMVRTLEPIKTEKESEPDASTAEHVNMVKEKVSSLANRIAPHWIPLSKID